MFEEQNAKQYSVRMFAQPLHIPGKSPSITGQSSSITVQNYFFIRISRHLLEMLIYVNSQYKVITCILIGISASYSEANVTRITRLYEFRITCLCEQQCIFSYLYQYDNWGSMSVYEKYNLSS